MLQENICLTLLPKNAHGITQRPTLIIMTEVVAKDDTVTFETTPPFQLLPMPKVD